MMAYDPMAEARDLEMVSLRGARVPNMYEGVDKEEMPAFARATEDLPMNTARGMAKIREKLWAKHVGEAKSLPSKRIFVFFVMMGQIVLNVYTIFSQVVWSLFENELVFDGGTLVAILTEHHFQVCSGHGGTRQNEPEGARAHTVLAVGNTTANGDACFTTALTRLGTFRFVVWLEAILMGIMLIVTASVYVMFIWQESRQARFQFVKKFPLWFIVAPKVLTKFSLMSFLHWANSTRISAAYSRRDFLAFYESAGLNRWVLFCPQRCQSGEYAHSSADEAGESTANNLIDPADTERHSDIDSDDGEDDGNECDEAKNIVSLVVLLVLVGISIFAMLAKLTTLFTEVLLSYWRWNFTNWALFFGFVNQVGGIVLASEVELWRVLLFRFGGPNAKWTSTRVKRSNDFIKFLVVRVFAAVGRRGIVALATLGSMDVQKLCLSKRVAKHHKYARKTRAKMFTGVFSTSMSRESNMEVVEQLVRQGDEELRNLPQHMTSEENHDTAARLLLASHIQDFINDIVRTTRHD